MIEPVRALIDLDREGFQLQVDLAIPPNETIALLGPNGSGKTTIVNVLSGLIPISRGEISFGDVVVDSPRRGIFLRPEQRNVGVVFQGAFLFPHLSVRENILFGPASRGLHRHEEAEDLMTDLGLIELADAKPGDLSGGEAQRVGLARALITDPFLLLMDEPFSSLDVTTRAATRSLLRDHLGAFAGPRLLITHDPIEAFLLAARIHILEQGRITQSGTPDDIRMRPRTRYAADLAGSNLLAGTATSGLVDIEGHQIRIGDTQIAGQVLLTIPPRAISLHTDAPGGSPRNAWRTTVIDLEDLGERMRVGLGEPVRLTAEITREAASVMSIKTQMRLWAAIKATEIEARER